MRSVLCSDVPFVYLCLLLHCMLYRLYVKQRSHLDVAIATLQRVIREIVNLTFLRLSCNWHSDISGIMVLWFVKHCQARPQTVSRGHLHSELQAGVPFSLTIQERHLIDSMMPDQGHIHKNS